MINKFKLWLNRNDLKLLVIIIIIVMIYILLDNSKSSNVTNELTEENENYLYENSTTNGETSNRDSNNFTQLDKSTEECQRIISVVQKIINSFYQANLIDDNLSLRQDIYNMMSDQIIQSLLNDGESISVDSVLNYIFYVDNINNYAIGKIYKLNETNNVIQYAVVLRHQKENNDSVDNYLIINMDYNNNTFSYGGIVNNLDDFDSSGNLNEIKNKGSNRL